MSENPTLQTLGRRIRAARERLHVTQRDVATHLGIPRTAVSDIEQGKREVSAVELFALSRLFGEPMERLLGVEPPGEAEGVMLRAERAGPTARAELGRFLELCRAYTELEEWLGERRPWAPPPLDRPVSSYGQAHQLADAERKRLDLGQTPGRVLLDVLEERLGVKVLALELDDGLSGASVLSAELGPCVLVNSGHTGGRQVFTFAHEYFHLITGATGSAERRTRLTHICVEAGAPGGRAKPRDEQLADQFAGRLLLPPVYFVERLQALRREDGTIDRLDLIDLARYFGVSVQALFVGLARLKLVPWEVADGAYRDAELQQAIAERGGERRPEPKRFKRLAVKAHVAGKVSRARLAELLDVSVVQVEAELERLGAGGGTEPIKLALPG